MICLRCQGCGCPACLGTGSGFTKRLVQAWRAGLTPEKVPNLPVSEQYEIRGFVRTHQPLLEVYHAKPAIGEQDFLVEPTSQLIPADQPRRQRVRFEDGRIQIRVMYDHATEEVPAAYSVNDTRLLLGIMSDRLFMAEFRPTESVEKDIAAVKYAVDSIKAWPLGPQINHEYALSNATLIAKWFTGLKCQGTP